MIDAIIDEVNDYQTKTNDLYHFFNKCIKDMGIQCTQLILVISCKCKSAHT
jgi:hypothetical protein